MKTIKNAFISFITILFLCILTSCRQLNKYDHMIYTMDTIVSISIYSTDKAAINEHFEQIENIYSLYHQLANDYTSYTNLVNIKTLNEERSGIVSNELYDLLQYAIDLREETNGYYEPFIGILSHKWKDDVLNNNNPILPDSTDIENELKKIKTSSLNFEDNNMIKIIGEANLDLGGLAKGYATQRVKEYLVNEKVQNYLVNAGNSNLLLSSKPKDENFSIGITNLKGDAYYEIISTKHKAIVTSSYKEQNKVIDGVTYTHLLNPKTGYPISTYASLTLVGDDQALLDAYSTALYAMSIEEIKSFLFGKGIDILIYGPEEKIYSTWENTK